MTACGGSAPTPASAPSTTAPAPAEAAVADDAAEPDDTNTDLNFTLVNATDYDIEKLYLSPSSSNEWEANSAGKVDDDVPLRQCFD